MPDAIDKPDEGEAALEEGGAGPVAPTAHTCEPPVLKLPAGVSASDNGNTLPVEPGDEGFGELTEAQWYEESDTPLGDGLDGLWDELRHCLIAGLLDH